MGTPLYQSPAAESGGRIKLRREDHIRAVYMIFDILFGLPWIEMGNELNNKRRKESKINFNKNIGDSIRVR